MAIPGTKFEDLTFTQKLLLVMLFPLFAIVALVGYGIDWLCDIFDVVDNYVRKEKEEHGA